MLLTALLDEQADIRGGREAAAGGLVRHEFERPDEAHPAHLADQRMTRQGAQPVLQHGCQAAHVTDRVEFLVDRERL
jgi:hypothetical protein